MVEPECDVTELNEKEIAWMDESIDNWLHEAGIGFYEDAIYWATRLTPVPVPETAAASGGARRRRPTIPNAQRKGKYAMSTPL